MNKVRKKILRDISEQKDEPRRMRKQRSLIWRIRGWVATFEYWIIAFDLPISVLIFVLTEDFWKALAFYAVTLIYHFSANLRGLSLHIENYIEWVIGKTI